MDTVPSRKYGYRQQDGLPDDALEEPFRWIQSARSAKRNYQHCHPDRGYCLDAASHLGLFPLNVKKLIWVHATYAGYLEGEGDETESHPEWHALLELSSRVFVLLKASLRDDSAPFVQLHYSKDRRDVIDAMTPCQQAAYQAETERPDWVATAAAPPLPSNSLFTDLAATEHPQSAEDRLDAESRIWTTLQDKPLPMVKSFTEIMDKAQPLQPLDLPPVLTIFPEILSPIGSQAAAPQGLNTSNESPV